jgi:uncharacterized membrane protein
MVRQKLDYVRIKRAISAAERQTSATICVSIAPPFWGSVLALAQKAFVRLKLHQTPERNSVLVFVVPRRRQFVVWGDVGIHTKLAQRDWDSLVFAMAERFEDGDQTGAIEFGVGQIVTLLAVSFPASFQPAFEPIGAHQSVHGAAGK